MKSLQMKSKLSVLEDLFSIHRLLPDNEIPMQLFERLFCSITKTEDELSVICSSSVPLNSASSETGWSCIKILGALNFTLTGFLADVLAVLAKAKISVLAISTFDTDYILAKSDKRQTATKALRRPEQTFSN